MLIKSSFTSHSYHFHIQHNIFWVEWDRTFSLFFQRGSIYLVFWEETD
ncbi:hypothetical protein HMPREF9374_1493 [Desmospora sp. 8437]|nr:hypothetical protein HMPREF9374_1493 [Desmospora sp. 8437]